MTHKPSLKTTTALTIAISIFAGSLLPIAQASAHDRNHAGKHGYNHNNWNKRSHRKFHNHYGRGNHGVHAYNKQKQHHQVKRKKSKKGNLIAAGVIGLALGAIIASESSKRQQTRHNTYNRPAPQPTYQYDNNGQPHALPRTNQHIPLDNYNNAPVQNHNQTTNGHSQGNPNVITFRDSASLEPWTPGWREWCSNRYRSFNQQTGTYRGFDGFDHFCVPK